jgi:hypothetical protein
MTGTPGAYGLRLSGLPTAEWLGVTGAAHWPEIACSRDGRADAPELALAIKSLELRVRADVSHSELVHPLLGRVASHVALARGADGMHAGAVASSTGAWAVIGPKGAGKSTLLAALAGAGIPIVTDDVLIFRAGQAMAGPRCIDLRPDVARFGQGVAVRPSDLRHRMALPPIVAEHQLVGLIYLEWSHADTTTIDSLDHREAVRRLLSLRSEKGYPRDPGNLLDLAALPTLLLRRPRSFDALDDCIAQIRRLLCGSRAGGDRPRRDHRAEIVPS